MKVIEIILALLTVSMIILSIVNIHLIRDQIENNLMALDLLDKLFKEKYGEFFPPPENRETLDHSCSSNLSWTPEEREVERLRRMIEDDDWMNEPLIRLDDMVGLRKER